MSGRLRSSEMKIMKYPSDPFRHLQTFTMHFEPWTLRELRSCTGFWIPFMWLGLPGCELDQGPATWWDGGKHGTILHHIIIIYYIFVFLLSLWSSNVYFWLDYTHLYTNYTRLYHLDPHPHLIFASWRAWGQFWGGQTGDIAPQHNAFSSVIPLGFQRKR